CISIQISNMIIFVTIACLVLRPVSGRAVQTEQTHENFAEKRAERSTEESSEETAESSVEEDDTDPEEDSFVDADEEEDSTASPTEENAEEPSEDSSEDSAEEADEDTLEDTTESSIEQDTEEPSEESLEGASGKPEEDSSEETEESRNEEDEEELGDGSFGDAEENEGFTDEGDTEEAGEDPLEETAESRNEEDDEEPEEETFEDVDEDEDSTESPTEEESTTEESGEDSTEEPSGKASEAPKENPKEKATKSAKDAHCPSQSEMTDEVRQMFLDKHNKFRSIVAKGEAKDALGGNAPKAAKLPKLTYDCDVESKAMEWIKKCEYESSHLNKSLDLGENLFMTTRTNDKVVAADQSTNSWFSSLAIAGVGKENIFKDDLHYAGSHYYTQMVWQDTHKLGCAAVACKRMMLVGCLYNPSGNIDGKLIYEIGEPCSGSGCKCSKDEGLCVV
uniref:SCP domain-containing protein n=1 Tax=Haemonchus contortus TaxID=6289 RepID=A0A7I5EC77_HAECO